LPAVGVETGEVFVELLGVRDVMSPFFKLGGLEQFLGLVAGTT